MTPEGDRHIAAIAAVPPIVFFGTIIEIIISPTAGDSFVLLAFVLLSPLLVGWLIWRLMRTDA